MVSNIRSLASPLQPKAPKAPPTLPSRLAFSARNKKSFHTLQHFTMIGGRPKGIGIIALQVSFAFNGFGFGHLGFMAGKPNALGNQIGNLLGFSGSGSEHNQDFRHGCPPNAVSNMLTIVSLAAYAARHLFFRIGNSIISAFCSTIRRVAGIV
jgi:hypothetical protein